MGILERIFAEASPASILFATSILLFTSFVVYRTYFDPLSNIPGPLICRLTSLWAWTHSYIGDESRRIDALHKKYGPVVRIAPDEVVLSEGAALGPVYSERGGFLKAPCYSNFDSEGHETIFSTLDPKYRGIRSKAVMPMFSTANIRDSSDVIESCIDGMVERLKEEASRSRQAFRETGKSSPVNVLNLARGLAIDAVTSYLFGKDYRGIHEDSPKLSASLYVDSIVAFGRFFFLPPWLFVPIYALAEKLSPTTHELTTSATKVTSFTTPLVSQPPHPSTFQSRLLRAGCSAHEADVQMKDVIFAGTDTTGTNFASLLFHLAQNPQIHARLRSEILSAEAADPQYNPHTLKYLDSVIRETLRVSMANPTRFPRQVPPSGFAYTSPSNDKTYHLPPGTIVGLQPYTLHCDPAVFPDPHSFNPDRWLNATPEMLRNHIPFGLGPRQCIARNLAMMEMCLATRAVVKSNVLEGAKPVKDKIEMLEWFNAKIVGERIDLGWE